MRDETFEHHVGYIHKESEWKSDRQLTQTKNVMQHTIPLANVPRSKI